MDVCFANKAAAVANRPAIAARRPAFAPSLSARSPKVATTARAAEAQASPFSAVDSEEALFAILKAGAGSGQVPPRLIGAVSELYTNYKAAIMGSGLEGADEAFVARVMASVCERVLMQLNPPPRTRSRRSTSASWSRTTTTTLARGTSAA